MPRLTFRILKTNQIFGADRPKKNSHENQKVSQGLDLAKKRYRKALSLLERILRSSAVGVHEKSELQFFQAAYARVFE